QGRQKNPIDN
ncbi:hypothetical protein D034_1577B, partial [Vibrio parahaemolyticus Peru-288]